MDIKKKIIIDINPGNDQITKELIIGQFATILKTISKKNILILCSHSSLFILKKIANAIGLKNGYIISDFGARIYDIGTKTIL
jgi:hydroxymethylpyrimidine pyrophosphatase-like HAD family hydrolase